MKKVLIFSILILSSIFQVFAQSTPEETVGTDSLKAEAYMAYINAKEKEILKNKNERLSLEASLVEEDSLLMLSKAEQVEVQAKNKAVRLDVNAVETGISTHQEALTYNKNRTVAVNDAQLVSKKRVDLTRLELTETKRTYEELELRIAADKDKIKRNTGELRKQEEQVRQLDIEYKKRENLVEINETKVTSLTISLDEASTKEAELKREIAVTATRIDQIDSDLINEQKEKEAIENKITENQKKLEANANNASSWETQLKKVKEQIEGLENNKQQKGTDLNEMPDSLKTSKVLEATQQEIRMINDHLKKLNGEAYQLEQDVSQLKEVSRVIKTENETFINEKNVSQSRLVSMREDKQREENKFKSQRDNKQALSVKIHDISTEKEQVYISLQKAENELGYYKGEYDKRNEQLQQGEAEQAATRDRVTVNLTKKDSVATVKDNLTDDFNEVTTQNQKENAELKKLRSNKRSLATSLDSLQTESKQVGHRQKVVDKEVQLIDEEINKHEENKELMENRILELTNTAEDEILKGIEEAKNGQFDNFLLTLGDALEKDKSSATSHTLIGYTHYIKGDLDQAEDAYTDAINESPRFIDPYVLRAELREDKSNYNGALKDYNQVVYLDSTKAEAYYKQGVLLYYFLNEPDEGCESWKMAFKLGVKEANEKLIEHCSNSAADSRYYVITQLTKRAIKDSYGFEMSNPIRVGKNKERQDYNIVLYLQLLRDVEGKPVQFVRYGSCCRYTTENGLRNEGLLESYRVTYKNEEGKKIETTLYFTFYDFNKPKVPKGFNTNHDIY
jgi:chromosome segregation ATPase